MKIKGKAFAITGGASQIGTHIADLLLSEGATRVVAIDNMSLGSLRYVEAIVDKRFEFARGDVLRLDQLLHQFKGIDGVFHAAGFLTMPLAKDLRHGIDVNVTGTLNVLDACHLAGVQKLVFSSSVAVFGNANGPVNEESPFDRSVRGYSSPAAVYGSTKIIGEHLARLYAERHGLETVSLRYASVYGPRQHGRAVNTLLLTDPIDQVRRGERPKIYGDGSEVHDYTHVLDIAAANIAGMESAVKSGAYTIATGNSVSVDKVVRIVLGLFGSKLEPEYLQEKRALTAAAPTDLSFDVSRARADLNWESSIDISKGLKLLKEGGDGEAVSSGA